MGEPLTESVSPWLPEQDRIRLATLGKLIEELNEASSRAARCIIHGLDEIDPDTHRPNRVELERELADVLACITMAAVELHIEPPEQRQELKTDHFQRWHALIDEAEA